MTDQNTPSSDPAPQADARPEWLPQKFSSPEQMAEAYAQLESRMGAEGAPAAPQAAPETPAAPQAAPATPGQLAGIPEAPAAPPAVWSDEALARYSESIATTGDLTAEDRAALTAAGIPEAQINSHVSGWKAQQQLATQTVLGITGGQEGYEKMVQWATTAIPANEQQVFNAALNSGDVNAASAAVRGLWAQFQAGAGNPIQHRGGPAPTVTGFANQEQLLAAQKDPRYRDDPAYRQEVITRLQASSFYKS